MKAKLTIILAGSLLFLFAPVLALTEESLPGIESLMPGSTEGVGTYFEVTDSEYLNVFLQSSNAINATLESIPKTISLRIESSISSNSSVLTIGGLASNTTYYKFQDSYKNEAVFVSDSQGSYTWTQDLTQQHHIWFQEVGGTVFLPQDCSNYGMWDGQTNTCTLSQNLNQNVEIVLSDITLDCASHSITGTHAGYGIYLNWKSGVALKNCNVNNFSYGIYLFGGSDNTLIGNSAVNGEYGILFNSHNNTLINNTADSNNLAGILIDNSPNNTLVGNAMSGNRYNFYLWGAFDSQNINISNTVDGKPIYYLINAANQTYGSSTNAGTFYCINCDNITVKDLTLTKNAYGVFFWRTNNSRIENINAQNDLVGIWFESSSDNALSGNITNSNDWYGALLVDSDNNIFTNNTFSSNSDAGVRFHDSGSNILTDNNISNNTQYGIYIYYYSFAKIYHNNFINNPTQVYITEASSGTFDNGYPDGGNYWSDYTGQDQYSGPNQDQPGSDKIGDTPYVLNIGQDRYPFTREDGWKIPSVVDIQLTWSKNQDPDFESYRIFRDTDPSIDTNDTLVANITDQTQTTFLDENLPAGTVFYYKVFVFDKAGFFSGSDEESTQ